jgi:hypothetical protein
MADGRFDDLLLAFAKKHKNVEELSNSVLSFFERRTDLFHVMETPTDRMGFRPGVAEKMTMKHFRFFQARYLDRCQPHLLGPEPEAEAGAAADAPAADGTSADAAAGGAAAAATAAASSSSQSSSADASGAGYPAQASEESKGDSSSLPEGTRKMMRHISTWNGAATDKYYWSQSISEVTVEVVVGSDASAKDLKVDVTNTRLSIKCKGSTILEGKLHEKVTAEESIWHLDDGKIILSVEKQRQTWWKCVLEGDQEIDTTKVESVRTMDEYDGETQGAIRKIMFDQHQKAMGKPNSDQLRTAEVMKEAWNAPGSPFRGSDFDPTMLNLSGPVPDDFFAEVEKRRLDEALQKKEQDKAAATSG